MEGQWTYSSLDIEWVNDTYDTKEEAIESAKERFEDGCVIGQLEHKHSVNYKVINQETVTFS
ncbi:hypothetical protein ACFFIX_06545 [Metabacillus herbersteinensis]|uniref:DUF2188 domain-containing protein n=1 Tax=Metabacillus herbersteinensis TaxID=283816 RepID=A0ABV6GC02_9BACI